MSLDRTQILQRVKRSPVRTLICAALIALAIFWPTISPPQVNFHDTRTAEGLASCVHRNAKYGSQGGLFVDGQLYYSGFSRGDGLKEGSCDKSAHREQVRVLYAEEDGSAGRRLLVGAWRLRDGKYLAGLPPAQKIELWQGEFSRRWDALALRLVLIAVVVSLWRVGSKSNEP